MCNTGIKVAGNKIKGKEFQIPIHSFRSFPRDLKSEIEPPTQVTDLPPAAGYCNAAKNRALVLPNARHLIIISHIILIPERVI
jgi:hypothetical protein